MKKPFCFVDYISDETNYYIKWYLESSNEETQRAEASAPGGKQQPPASKKPKTVYPEDAGARNYLIFMITTSYPQQALVVFLLQCSGPDRSRRPRNKLEQRTRRGSTESRPSDT